MSHENVLVFTEIWGVVKFLQRGLRAAVDYLGDLCSTLSTFPCPTV